MTKDVRHHVGTRRSAAHRPGSKRQVDPARRTAYLVLAAVSTRDAYANLLLAATLRESGLHGKDAALATELVYGVLRHRGSYDAIIAICADRDLDRIDAGVLDALRLGVHQLLGMRIKTHAAVATAVDLAVEVLGRGRAGFVNAVLRRVALRDLESWIGIAAPDPSADPVGHLAVRHSHPRWIVEAFAHALGEAPGDGLRQTEAALAADNARPTVHLAAVPGLADPADLIGAGATAARWSPFGAYSASGDPGSIDAVAQRRAGVQDEASQLAAVALASAGASTSVSASAAGQRWLDLCAGPGGKARLLSGLASERGAVLLAADLHHHRAVLTAGAVSPAARAAVVTADGLAPPWLPASFDRVLADLPCSGLGSLRRRPEARWRREPTDIPALARLQRDLLVSAIDSARPGGIVGYVTCSPHLAETRHVLADVLGVRDHVEVLDAPAVLSQVPDLRCPEPYSRYAQFWPHRHGTDAIFVALLRLAG
ncbi:MAG TPA: transcription antitermination factor NusB [Streptosporangiaceae bacterium]|nr:transcription antitermination factor NusB [Streptosporangiaceae bacterium]